MFIFSLIQLLNYAIILMVINMNTPQVYQCRKCNKDFVFKNNSSYEKCNDCGYTNYNNFKTKSKINNNPIVKNITSGRISLLVLKYSTIILLTLTAASLVALFLKQTSIFLIFNISSVALALLLLIIFYENYYNSYSYNKTEANFEYLALAALLLVNVLIFAINMPLINYLDIVFISFILIINLAYYLLDSKQILIEYINEKEQKDPNAKTEDLIVTFKRRKSTYESFTKNILMKDDIPTLIFVYLGTRFVRELVFLFLEITQDIFLINLISYLLYFVSIVAPILIYGFLFYDRLISSLNKLSYSHIRGYYLRFSVMNSLFLAVNLLLTAFYIYDLLVIRLGVI